MAKILIIDDNPRIRELLMEELVDEGYLVEITGDAESIERLLDFSKTDLILIDLYMNGRNRWDILHAIRKKNPHMPILLHTAYDSYREDPRLSEADGFVIKSMYFDDLKKKVSEILQGKAISSDKVEKETMISEFNTAQSL
jgi:DNA-binding NtrC family response regulator